MPSTSKKQQRLMAAAEHGASFPKAKALRKTMTGSQLHDFAAGPMAGKPERVGQVGAVPKAKGTHPHRNLGKYLHRKGG